MHSLRRAVTTVLLIVFSIAFVAFAVANRDFVAFSFFPLPYSFEMPKFLFVLMCFAFGLIIGGLTLSLSLGRAKLQLRSERQRSLALESEVKALRMEHNDRADTALLP